MLIGNASVEDGERKNEGNEHDKNLSLRLVISHPEPRRQITANLIDTTTITVWLCKSN